ITVALDLHGNVTQKMMDNADILVGFKTYPHIDMYEAGQLAGKLLLQKMAGQINTAMAWRRLPLMTHTLKSSTQSPAMKSAVGKAIQLEEKGDVHAATI